MDRITGYVAINGGRAAYCVSCVGTEEAPAEAVNGREVYNCEVVDRPWTCATCGEAIECNLSGEGLRALADELADAVTEGRGTTRTIRAGLIDHAQEVIRLAAALTRERDRLAKARAEAPPVVTLALTAEEADYLIGALDEAWEANDERLNDRAGCDPQDAQPMQEQNAAWMQLREKARAVRAGEVSR